MIEENNDQVIDDVVDELADETADEKDDQASDEQSEETKDNPTIEDLSTLVKGIQKGYTLNAQAIADIRNNIQPLVDKINEQSDSETDNEEYLTVGKLKSILSDQSRQQQDTQVRTDAYINNTLAQLRASGIIKSKEEEEELIQYAVDKKETDLSKAADRWQEVKQAKADAKKSVAKTKAQQEEGSKIGTSSKTSTTEKGGVDYDKIKNLDWSDF